MSKSLMIRTLILWTMGVSFCLLAFEPLKAWAEPQWNTLWPIRAGLPPLLKAKVDAQTPVIIVGQKVITLRDLELRLRLQSLAHVSRLSNPYARRAFVDQTIDFELLAREALNRGWQHSPQALWAEKQGWIVQYLSDQMTLISNPSPERFRNFLKTRHLKAVERIESVPILKWTWTWRWKEAQLFQRIEDGRKEIKAKAQWHPEFWSILWNNAQSPDPRALEKIQTPAVTLLDLSLSFGEVKMLVDHYPSSTDKALKDDGQLQKIFQSALEARLQAIVWCRAQYKDRADLSTREFYVQRAAVKAWISALPPKVIREKEILDYYQKHLNFYHRPERRRALLARFPSYELAQQAYSSLLAFTSVEQRKRAFGQLKNSHDALEVRDTAYLAASSREDGLNFPDAIRKALFKLKSPGDFSLPFQDEDRQWVILLYDRQRPAIDLPFDKVRDQIEKQLKSKARPELDLIKALKGSVHIQRFDHRLKDAFVELPKPMFNPPPKFPASHVKRSKSKNAQ